MSVKTCNCPFLLFGKLAGLCDRTKENIGVIESGKSAPSFEMILKIADALEIHPADLFLRNASQNQEDVRKFFDEELSVKMKEMVEKRFPVSECESID